MGGLPFCNSGATLVLALLCISLVTATSDIRKPSSTVLPEQSCTTEICQQAADALIESLDTTIEPCDDFYAHACGGWIAKHPLENSEPSIKQEKLLEIKSLKRLKESLEERETSDTGAVKKAKDFYQSCVNEDSISSRGIDPVISIVAANGGWPLTIPSDQWSLNEKLTLQKIYESYVNIGDYWPVLAIGITTDNTFGEQKTLTARGAVPPWRSWRVFKIKRKNAKLATYKSYVKAVIHEFIKTGGFNVSSTDLDKDINDTVAFERELWTAIASSTGGRNTVITIADLQTKWNSSVTGRPELAIDWLQVIRSSFSETGATIDETEKILLHPKDHIADIANLLQRTPVRTIVNYIHWYVIYDTLKFTNVEKRLMDDKEVVERPEWCLQQRELEHAYSYVYVRKYFNNASLNTANDIVSRMQIEMKRQFNRTKFFNDYEKFVGSNELGNIRKHVGYPSWYDEPGKIDEYYKELTIGSNLYENALNIRRFYGIKSGKALRESYAGRETPSFTTYPKFDEYHNSLILPAGSLQLPLFHPELPLSMNYGSTGLAVGRKIAYAFIYNGLFGNNDNPTWLSISTVANYYNKTKCFIDQYNKYPLIKIDGAIINVSGEANLQDHVIDNVGIKLALKAYLSYKEEKNIEDVKIPALKEYSNEQLFFYSTANRFCAAYKPSYVAQLSTVDRVRVNGALSNFKEFSNAFNCSSKSPMNPGNKCALLD